MSTTRAKAATYEAYVALASESRIVEWVGGEVVEHVPPTTRHQKMALFLARLLATFVERGGLGEVFIAPYAMRLGPQGPVREPDVLFVAQAHAERVKPDGLEGPADLVIEILSQDSVARDRVDKFYEYEEAGVAEYWVIDPRPGHRQRAEFWVLGRDGTYAPVPVDDSGVYASAVVPGLRLRRDWLFADPLPTVAAAYGEMEGAR